jgi:hypothetical protein
MVGKCEYRCFVLLLATVVAACGTGSGGATVAPGDCNTACDVMTSCFGFSRDGCLQGCNGKVTEQPMALSRDGLAVAQSALSDSCWACFDLGCAQCEAFRACLIEKCETPADAMAECKTDPGNGQVVNGKPTSYAATAVGGWSQIGSTCSSGSVLNGYAYFLCPGGRIRGGGDFSGTTELVCGTYNVTPPSMSNCTDKVGCFPKVHATVKDTLILGGQEDVDPSFSFTIIIRDDADPVQLWKDTKCDNGSDGYIVLGRVAGDAGDDYCVSSACPASGGSGGSYGSCGTDCDCGVCWYCESGTCRYGGEGPYGCYRGCSG